METIVGYILTVTFLGVIGGMIFYMRKVPVSQETLETPPVPTTPLADPVPEEPVIDSVGNLDLFATAQRTFESWQEGEIINLE